MLLLGSCSLTKQGDEDELYLIQETIHGKFYSPSQDDDVQQVIQELALNYESNYERLTTMFQFSPSKKTRVHVYTDREQFYKIIGRQTEGTYDAKDNIIKVFTPPQIRFVPSLHSEYTDQLVHEFIHAIIQQIHPAVGSVKWLDEGTAFYAALQLEDALNQKHHFREIPTLEQLNSPTFFDDYGSSAYFYSGLMIQFIVDEYGLESLNEIIREPLALETILDTTMDQLYLYWKAYCNKEILSL
ncbi:hypothetical protein D3C74_212740 [compost metagenome]